MARDINNCAESFIECCRTRKSAIFVINLLAVVKCCRLGGQLYILYVMSLKEH